MKSIPRVALELYSYAQLARMWHRSVRTIQDWVSADRQAGHPIIGTYRQNARHQRREFLLRGDCAWQVYARHVRVEVIRPQPAPHPYAPPRRVKKNPPTA